MWPSSSGWSNLGIGDPGHGWDGAAGWIVAARGRRTPWELVVAPSLPFYSCPTQIVQRQTQNRRVSGQPRLNRDPRLRSPGRSLRVVDTRQTGGIVAGSIVKLPTFPS